MSNFNFKKLLIFILIVLLIFNETICDALSINFLSYADELFVLILFVYSIVSILIRKTINKFSIYLLFFIILFSFVGILSCYLNSKFNFKLVILSNFLTIKFWLLLFSFCNISFSKNTRKSFKECLETIGKIVIVFALFNILFPNLFYKLSPYTISHRFGFVCIISLFNHPGKYGWFMLFMAIYYYNEYKNTKQKKFIFNSIIFLIFSIFSFRTKVIIGVVVIVLYELIINNKKIIKYLVPTCIILGIVLFSFRNIIINTYNLYFSNSYNNKNEARVVLRKYGKKIMINYFPLGVGFGKYGSYYAKSNYSEYYTKYGFENIYGLSKYQNNYATDTFWPSIYAETGFIGFLLYICMLLIVYYYLRKTVSYYNSSFAILIFIQSICESFGEPSFNSSPQYLFLAMVIGYTISATFKKMKEKGECYVES